MPYETESEFWSKRVRTSFPGHIERIESLSSLGVPDTYFTLGGVSGWIELKVLRRQAPVKHDELLDWGIRQDQAKWHWRWTRAGGISLILVEQLTNRGPFYYVFHGCHALRARMRIAPVPFLCLHGLQGNWPRIFKLATQCYDDEITRMIAEEAAGCA